MPRQLTWSDVRADRYHYRTKDKVEVDAVLENSLGQAIAIEVKAATTVTSDDFRGLRHLADRLGDDLLAGYVLHTGTDTLPFGPKLRALPIDVIPRLRATARYADVIVVTLALRGTVLPHGAWRQYATICPAATPASPPSAG